MIATNKDDVHDFDNKTHNLSNKLDSAAAVDRPKKSKALLCKNRESEEFLWRLHGCRISIYLRERTKRCTWQREELRKFYKEDQKRKEEEKLEICIEKHDMLS